MMHGDPVTMRTDIQARMESMGTGTITSKGFLVTHHSTAFSVVVLLMQGCLYSYEYCHSHVHSYALD